MNSPKIASENFNQQLSSLLSPEKKELWLQDYPSVSLQASPAIFEILAEFFSLLKRNQLEICAVSRAFNLKQIAETNAPVRLEKYMSENQQHAFFNMGAFFREQLETLKLRSQEKGIAGEGNVIADACTLQKFKGKKVLLLDKSDIAVEGKFSIEIDNRHWVHHMFKIGSTCFPMMETKCLALSNLEPIYFNEFLFDLPPRTAFIKKYGEQAAFALWQESSISERTRKF